MKIVIIDNDKKICQTLPLLLCKLGCETDLIKTGHTIEEGIKLIQNELPDLLFLDVELDNGTGFDLLNKISHHNFTLIFITAHDKYAIKAIKMGAIDFLQKPILIDELKESLSRAKDNILNKDIKLQLSVVQQQLKAINKIDQKIVLRDGSMMHFVNVQDIIHCEADGCYTTIYFVSQPRLVVSKSLKEFEEMLSEYGFIRTHNSHLVNMRQIVRIEKSDGGTIILENGKNIPISQRKKDIIYNKLISK